ncbi:uncharacterized protein LOC113593370 [Acinonyx jubatus]|uniref:Uncharacterized protein LOC113593370 n=1 Tax=Acinonyx jubatus TaxID=32536 RepID=A0ABM3P4S7_ACIJB|nr:uncharacterized protein LOC113593370 [Acinonyx jubatus]
MASPSCVVSSIRVLFSLTSNRALILCVQLPSTPRFHNVRDQAVRLPGSTSLLSFISEAAVFPNPSLLRDCGFVPLRPSAGGSHRALAGAGHPQEHSRDCAAANAQRLRLGASPPQKKFTRACSSGVSGILENHNSHLAPGFTRQRPCPSTSECGCSPGSAGTFARGESSQQGNRLLCGLRTSVSAPGDSPLPSELHQPAASTEYHWQLREQRRQTKRGG